MYVWLCRLAPPPSPPPHHWVNQTGLIPALILVQSGNLPSGQQQNKSPHRRDWLGAITQTVRRERLALRAPPMGFELSCIYVWLCRLSPSPPHLPPPLPLPPLCAPSPIENDTRGGVSRMCLCAVCMWACVDSPLFFLLLLLFPFHLFALLLLLKTIREGGVSRMCLCPDTGQAVRVMGHVRDLQAPSLCWLPGLTLIQQPRPRLRAWLVCALLVSERPRAVRAASSSARLAPCASVC